jgi:hypothetical protein
LLSPWLSRFIWQADTLLAFKATSIIENLKDHLLHSKNYDTIICPTEFSVGIILKIMFTTLILLKLFQKTKEGGTLPNSFSEAKTTLKTKIR